MRKDSPHTPDAAGNSGKDQSADDVLEDTRETQEAAPEESQKPLAGDYDSPAAESNNPFVTPLPEDHPLTDANMEESEIYEKGRSAAAYEPSNPGNDDVLKEIV